MAYFEGEIPVSTGNNSGVVPVLPYSPMGYGYGNNGGFFGNGDGIWAILLFAMIFGNNGFGGGFNGNGGYGNMMYDINANTNRGFDNLAVTSGIDSLQNTVSNGFANAEVSRCNAQTNLLQTLNSNQNALTSAITNGFFDVAMANQKCCCQNQLGVQDLKATVISENCADREALSNGIRDIIASNTANTQAILDKLCQQELDAERRENQNLRTQLNMADLRASQSEQTARILQGQNSEIDALYNRLSNCPVPSTPVYGRVPIFTCNSNNGCGCGCGNF